MAKISQDEQKKIKDMFADKMEGNVNILYFTTDNDCEYCEDTEEILTEISELDDKISFEVNDIDSDEAKDYGLEMAPATIFVDEDGKDSGVHFYGIPSGYEFNTLIEDIIDISKETPDVPEDMIEKIKEIDSEVKLQVFVTPSCPYCPRAVRVAHQMAMLNDKVTGDMVEAVEFPDLSDKYGVSGVPKTIINEGAAEQVGAVPLKAVISKIQQTVAN
ncbi:MAG: protein disulfide oxidoreductase [Bacillota bacterium]